MYVNLNEIIDILINTELIILRWISLHVQANYFIRLYITFNKTFKSIHRLLLDMCNKLNEKTQVI